MAETAVFGSGKKNAAPSTAVTKNGAPLAAVKKIWGAQKICGAHLGRPDAPNGFKASAEPWGFRICA